MSEEKVFKKMFGPKKKVKEVVCLEYLITRNIVIHTDHLMLLRQRNVT